MIESNEKRDFMDDKYLSIGSVVLLDGGSKKLMITGYLMQTEERPGVIFDYSGCLYPEGVIRSDIVSVFNHSQIKEIFSKGYSDDESLKFLESLKERNKEEKEKFIPKIESMEEL